MVTFTFNNSNSKAESIENSVQNGINFTSTSGDEVYDYQASGAAPVFPPLNPGQAGELILFSTPSKPFNLPAGYNFLVDQVGAFNAATPTVSAIGNGGSLTTVRVFDGGMTFNANGGSVLLQTDSNTGSYVPQGGTYVGDNILLNGTGSSTVSAGAGLDTITATAGSNTIAAANGTDHVFLTGGNNLYATEGADTINAGTGHNTVSAGSAGLLLFGGSGSLLFNDGGGASTILGGTGSTSIFGGSGGGLYFGGSNGGNLMLGGSGATDMIGGGSGDLIYSTGTASNVMVAGAGNESLISAFSAGTDAMYGGAGSDEMYVGSGTEYLIGGTGADVYAFIDGATGGSDIIYNFKVGTDQIGLFGYDRGTQTGAAAALSTATVSAYGTNLTLLDGTRILLVGVNQLAPNSVIG